MAYCNTRSPDWGTFRAKFNKEFFEKAEAADSGETLYIDTRWVVLYANEEQKIPADRVQNCLKMLNLIFGGQNTEELAKVPNTTRNPWQPRVGNPNIQFLPLDESTLNVEYQSISGTLSGSVPVDDAANQGGRVNGVLNIYIGSSGHGSILGQAELGSNIVYALYSAVGGYDIKGTLPGYDLGKTVAHEVGHALDLVHTFTDTACDGYSPYLDVPESVRPNFTTELFEVSPGVWDQKDDNRYKDRANGTQLSCLHVEPDPNTAPNDMGINIMDYGDDVVSIIFSQNQALMMRNYLQSDDNSTIELKSADAISLSAGGTSEPAAGGDDGEGGSGSAVVGGETSGDNDTSSGLSTAVIIVIAVFAALALILFLWFMVRYMRTSKGHAKQSSSYLTYI